MGDGYDGFIWKALPSEHKDLSLGSQHLHKHWGMVMHAGYPSAGEVEKNRDP